MTVTDTENTAIAGTEFTPFNDTDKPRIEQAVFAAKSASSGIDTTSIDTLREGVSIRTNKHRFGSTQPKIWAGNLNHFVTVRTIGQARSFTEFEDDKKFKEVPEFNPVWFIQDPLYPFPITFNNGPQQEEEAIIEPFVIKFRKPSIEGLENPRLPKAILEDGNTFDSPNNGANRIQQFESFTLPNEARFFLDEGQEYFADFQNQPFGDALKNSIIIEGFVPLIQRNIIPYNETKDERIVERIQTNDEDFISVLKALEFDLDGDIREDFDKRSATAGIDVYGPDVGFTGTDSITFIGRIRGA